MANVAVCEAFERTHSENRPACRRLQAPLDLQGRTSRVLWALEGVCFLSGEQLRRESHGTDSFLQRKIPSLRLCFQASPRGASRLALSPGSQIASEHSDISP